MEMHNQKFSKLEEIDLELLRLVLMTNNFFFNKIVKSIRRLKNNSDKEEKISKLSGLLSLPRFFVQSYIFSGKLDLEDVKTRQSVLIVHDSESGRKIIEEDGIYIKFDPRKPNDYYLKIIKQLRATFAFSDAKEEEKERFIKSGERSTLHFLDGKRAKRVRHQHGSNLEEDISIYLECQKALKSVFTTKTFTVVEPSDLEIKVLHALEFAAENLGLDKERVKNIYYEVCRRYQLPTHRNFPRLIQL